MKSCSICYEDKSNSDFIRLDCSHEFCKECTFELVAKQIKTDEYGKFPCPLCRCVQEINTQFVQKYKIPCRYFTAETAVLVDHVKVIYKDDTSYAQMKSKYANFRRAVKQNNIALVKYWLDDTSVQDNLNIFTFLRHGLMISSVDTCETLLKACVKNDYECTLSTIKDYLYSLQTSKEFTKQISKLDLLKPYLKTMHASQTEDSLISFSKHSMLDALQWWANNALSMEIQLSELCKIEDVEVLEWWRKQDSYFVKSLSSYSLDKVVNVDTLNWWKSNGEPFRYHENAIFNAVEQTELETLKWWHKNGLTSCLDSTILAKAVDSCDINIFKWVYEHLRSNTVELLPLLLNCLVICCERNQLEIFRYIVSVSSVSSIPSCMTIKAISRYGQVDIMQWFYEWHQENKIEFLYTESALDLASSYGHLDMIKWWFESGLSLKYTDTAMNLAFRFGHFEVIEYWQSQKNKVQLKYSIEMLHDYHEKAKDVLYWLSSDRCQLNLDDVILNKIKKLRKNEEEEKKHPDSRRFSRDGCVVQ